MKIVAAVEPAAGRVGDLWQVAPEPVRSHPEIQIFRVS